MTNFSRTWKSSIKPRKQRNYLRNMPLHLRNNGMAARLSAELRKAHGRKGIPVVKNDLVKVMRGSFRGTSGKVNSVNCLKSTAYIDGVESSRRDGTKVFVPVKVSNLLITQLNSSDSKRLKK